MRDEPETTGQAHDGEGADQAEQAFDRLMARDDTSMIVVTTAAGEVRAGCLVGFHTQSGIDPAEYAVWLSKANHTYRVGALAEHFAVHFPSSAQRSLAELFGGKSGDDVDKFEQCGWSAGPGGVPLLDDCPDRFVGRRVAWLDPGSDHVCLVLRPVLADVDDARSPQLLRLSEASAIEAGHAAEERQLPTDADRPG